MRGLCYFHVTVRTGDARPALGHVRRRRAERDARARCRRWRRSLPRDGRVPEPLRAGIVPPTEEELAGWASLPPGADELASQGARPADARGGGGVLPPHLGRAGASTSTASRAARRSSRRRCSRCRRRRTCRSGSSPARTRRRSRRTFERLLREAAPAGAEVEVDALVVQRRPGSSPPDAPAIQLALDAFEARRRHAAAARPLRRHDPDRRRRSPTRGIPAIVTGLRAHRSRTSTRRTSASRRSTCRSACETAEELFRRLGRPAWLARAFAVAARGGARAGRARALPPLRPHRHPVGDGSDDVSEHGQAARPLARCSSRSCRQLGLEDVELTEHGYVLATLPGTAEARRRRPDRARRHVARRARRRAWSRSSTARYDGGADRAAGRPGPGARPAPSCPSSPRASATTSSRATARRCSAPTTRPGWRRSWPRSRTSSRHPELRARTGARRLHGRRGGRARDRALRPRALRRRRRVHARRLGRRRDRDRDVLRLRGQRHDPRRRRASRHGQGQARERGQARRRARRRAAARPALAGDDGGAGGLRPPDADRGRRRGDGRRRSSSATTTTRSSTSTWRCSAARRRASSSGSRAPASTVEVEETVPQHAARASTSTRAVVEAAEEAIRRAGVEPEHTIIRGGTDGARLSEHGLPTPNLFTGGQEYHSVREWASVQDMAAAAATVVELVGVWAEQSRRARGRRSAREALARRGDARERDVRQRAGGADAQDVGAAVRGRDAQANSPPRRRSRPCCRPSAGSGGRRRRRRGGPLRQPLGRKLKRSCPRALNVTGGCRHALPALVRVAERGDGSAGTPSPRSSPGCDAA